MRDQIASNDRLTALRALLETASDLAETLAKDPLRDRFLRVYDRIPLQERATIVAVLEREIGFRIATRDGGAELSGYGAHLNPNARLYVRHMEKAPDKLPATLTDEEMMFSTLRSTRLMRLVLAPDIHPRWRATSREAFGLLEQHERDEVRQVLRELQEMLDEASEPVAPEEKVATG
jgi:hypothetical protein